MKKLSFFLLLLMLTVLAACGSDDSSSDENGNDDTQDVVDNVTATVAPTRRPQATLPPPATIELTLPPTVSQRTLAATSTPLSTSTPVATFDASQVDDSILDEENSVIIVYEDWAEELEQRMSIPAYENFDVDSVEITFAEGIFLNFAVDEIVYTTRIDVAINPDGLVATSIGRPTLADDPNVRLEEEPIINAVADELEQALSTLLVRAVEGQILSGVPFLVADSAVTQAGLVLVVELRQ